MQPPVTKNQRSIVKILQFDLLRDTPEGVGDRIGRTINFTENDAEGILDAISGKIGWLKSPEEDIIFDLVIKGIIPTELGSILASNLILWDEVRSLKYLHPRGASSLIFPRDFQENK